MDGSHIIDTSTQDRAVTGAEIKMLMEDLSPYCRSITGDGVRQTLEIIARHLPLEVHEVPTGTRVFDWTVPKEWNIRDAYVMNDKGERVIDFAKSHLHIVGYSAPVHRRMSLAELKEHLHSIPDQPDWVPYRTSYYDDSWGFCLAHNDLMALPEGDYDVVIDASFDHGSLSYGECVVPGKSEDEVLIYTHVCHPTMSNDNLSGIALATKLAEHLAGRDNELTYRFVFGPGTIGSISWLSRNRARLSRIRHGLVVALIGVGDVLTYKMTRNENAEIDRAAALVLRQSGLPHEIVGFDPYGYDERQFGSPGIALPVGRLTRSPHGGYPEYHTSADNMSLIAEDALGTSFEVCRDLMEVLDNNKRFINTAPYGEPQLGRRGVFRKVGGTKELPGRDLALLWVLNMSDGENSLLDIAERSGISFEAVVEAARTLRDCDLLVPASDSQRISAYARGHSGEVV